MLGASVVLSEASSRAEGLIVGHGERKKQQQQLCVGKINSYRLESNAHEPPCSILMLRFFRFNQKKGWEIPVRQAREGALNECE